MSTYHYQWADSARPYVFRVRYIKADSRIKVTARFTFERPAFFWSIPTDCVAVAGLMLDLNPEARELGPSFCDDLLDALDDFIVGANESSIVQSSFDRFTNLGRVCPAVNMRYAHPISGMEMTVGNIVMSLNDWHGWSREDVASWLETIDLDISFQGVEDV